MTVFNTVIRETAWHRKHPPPVHKPGEQQALLRRVLLAMIEAKGPAPVRKPAHLGAYLGVPLRFGPTSGTPCVVLHEALLNWIGGEIAD